MTTGHADLLSRRAATYSAEYSGFCLGAGLAAASGETRPERALRDLPDLAPRRANWVRQANTFHQEASGRGLTLAGGAAYEIQPNVALTAGAGWDSRVADQDGCRAAPKMVHPTTPTSSAR